MVVWTTAAIARGGKALAGRLDVWRLRVYGKVHDGYARSRLLEKVLFTRDIECVLRRGNSLWSGPAVKFA